MAYKITKYGGKHKIKDTKSGKSVDIDIEKYMLGGKETEPDETKPKKKLSKSQIDKIRQETGVSFTDEGANSLFESADRLPQPEIPEFSFGRYKDVGYFNVNYANGEFNVSPTKRNPGNYSKYKEYLDYLQKENPDVKINRKPNNDGYLKFTDRLEYGGKVTTTPEYSEGGECVPGSEGYPECLNENSVDGIDYSVMPNATKQDYDYYNDPEGIMMGQKNTSNQNLTTEEDFELMNLEQEAQENNDYLNSEEFKRDQANLNNQYLNNQKSLQDYLQEATNSTEVGNNRVPSKDNNFNISNPYAGVDIPSAANYLGQSIENKDALGIASSSLKVLTGLGRNVVSGLAGQNRYNQVMEDYYKDQKNSKNPVQYFAYGGKKDEELATGEYMRGVENEDNSQYNAEVEKGEYFKSNQGDVAEIVGKKHSQGGEKIEMQAEDKVLTDKLKLGGNMAKSLSEKYGLKLKAKNTYSDVLDKFRKKSKLDKIVEEEAQLNKKISEQDKVEDKTTRDFNLDVLTKKMQELLERKNPIEEERKIIFEELFDLQEMSKAEKNPEEDSFKYGGKKVPKYEKGVKIGDTDPKTGKKVTKEMAKEKVEAGEWEDLGAGNYVDRGENSVSSGQLQSYKETWDKEKFPNFEDYVYAAEEWKKANPNWRSQSEASTPDKFFYTEEKPVSPVTPEGIKRDPEGVPTAPGIKQSVAPNLPTDSLVIGDSEDIRSRNQRQLGAYLFPDESPLPPTSLQGTIKPERRFDRVRATEIDATPYLQDIDDREQSQINSLEGLSPNVRAAVLANVRANSQSQESKIRNQIDTQNLQSQEKANYRNADIQRMEENASEADRLAYEQRQYRAQSLTDNDISNYYNQLQAINKQRFMDIHNLNLINSTNEDVYFDGSQYRRKNTDQDILRQVKV